VIIKFIHIVNLEFCFVFLWSKWWKYAPLRFTYPSYWLYTTNYFYMYIYSCYNPFIL